MNEQEPGTEPVECSEIVYRALKKSWIRDPEIPAEAFMRRVRGMESEVGISLCRKKYATSRECRLKLSKMPRSASLHVGTVRDLPIGLDIFADPIRGDHGITDPSHCLLANLPDPVTESESAESAASLLVKIARLVASEEEERERTELDSIS